MDSCRGMGWFEGNLNVPHDLPISSVWIDLKPLKTAGLVLRLVSHLVLCCPLQVYRIPASGSYFGLEAAEELGQVWVSPRQGQDAFLSQGAVHVVILQDHILLQDFDGVDLVSALQLCQHHLLTRRTRRFTFSVMTSTVNVTNSKLRNGVETVCCEPCWK